MLQDEQYQKMTFISHIKEMTRHETLTAFRTELTAERDHHQGEYQCRQGGQQ